MKSAPATVFEPYLSGWKPLACADELEHFAAKMIDASEPRAASNKTHAAALEAAKQARRELVEFRENFPRAEGDSAASFRAAWSLRGALESLAKWEAKLGKAVNPNKAGREPRPKRNPLKTPLGRKITSLRETYLEETKTPSKREFAFEWLRENCDLEGLCFDDAGPFIYLEKDASEGAKPDTIRRWKLLPLSR